MIWRVGEFTYLVSLAYPNGLCKKEQTKKEKIMRTKQQQLQKKKQLLSLSLSPPPLPELCGSYAHGPTM